MNTTIIGEGQPPEFFQIRELQAVRLLIVAFTIILRPTENTHLLFPLMPFMFSNSLVLILIPSQHPPL
jgi:hypothetical protein